MATGNAPSLLRLWLMLALMTSAALATWMPTHRMRTGWANVPPVPSQAGFAMLALGDTQMAYRAGGLVVQNLGNSGGTLQPLKAYDYTALSGWFRLMHALDPHADFMPFLAAYYFGAVDDPDKLRPLVAYLAHAGDSPEGEKWRWLGQAVYLTRYKLNDLEGAYDLSLRLAAVDNPHMAMWARQMPALIQNARGDKRSAYEIMVRILADSAGKIDPVETRFMVDYICDKLVDEADRPREPLCRDWKKYY